MTDGEHAAGAADLASPTAIPAPRDAPPCAPTHLAAHQVTPAREGELDRLLLAGLLDADPEQVYFKDLEGRFLRVSRGLAYALGADGADEIVGRRAQDFLPLAEAARQAEDEACVRHTGVGIVELHERLERPGRGDRWVVTTRQPVRDADGEIVATLGVTRDITVRKLMEQRLEEHAAELGRTNDELHRVQLELREILRTSPDPTIRLDAGLRVRYANPAALAVVGRTEAELLGRTPTELGSPAALEELALSRCLSSGQGGEYEAAIPMPGGRTLYLHARLVPETDPDGAVTGVLLVGRDLTDRKRAEDLLADRAVRDPLTGLANRVLLTDRLQQAILRLDREPGMVALLFCDLDHFKDVNDTLGHSAGDALLKEVARRLNGCARRVDTVARFGGDEFVVLCERLNGREDAALVADRIHRALARPLRHRGHELQVTASIGIALVEGSHGGGGPITADTVIRDADDAMHQAKERGRGNGCYQFFDPRSREQVVNRLTVESQLREAMARDELHLAYQPLVSLADGTLVGVEALIRWHHPERGIVAPVEFIPIAEESGLIVEIGRWVLEEALRQVSDWNRRRPGLRPLTMAVNLSARQLGHSELVSDVEHLLQRYDVAPELLCLEVTETALLEEALSTVEVFAQLSALGVQLALDDFGTGYSSLVHLRRFPVDVLKIDRQFVAGLDGASGDDAIVAAVNAMAHALGMVTVAEGIETDAQLAELIRLGCDEGQGYLLARPLAPAALEEQHLFRTPSGEDA